MTEDLVRIAVLNDEMEANALGAALEQREIPHLIQTYYDSAYDGMFQLQKGWGCVVAAETHREAILGALAELRKMAQEAAE